jgi:hypothetical protein
VLSAVLERVEQRIGPGLLLFEHLYAALDLQIGTNMSGPGIHASALAAFFLGK